jgi:transcriptional regulator with XRE-family HTH domain
MYQDWDIRIRNYRQRSGLTQEALADLFMVDARTIRRWEAGQTLPPLEVRRKLQRTRVPIINRPEAAVFKQLVATSTEGIMLLDDELTILAMSDRELQWFQSQYGFDPRGRSWEPYIPHFFIPLLDRYGGWRATTRAGLSSITSDFRRHPPETGRADVHNARAQYTILHMADGMRIHIAVSSTLPDTAELHPPKMTFIDEIMSTE